MCGICGMLNFNSKRVDENLLNKMTDIISHRGPDGRGIYVNNSVGLGHRRLSIVDLSTGAQPMFNEDNSVVIVFNGEIYNHLDYREELIKKGHSFKTHCDTEIIIHLYEEYGKDCVHKLNGMFAFAIWDSKKETLFIARDRLGIKPIYYYSDPNRVVFASEIKSILEDSTIERKVNTEAIHDYFSFGNLYGDKTFFQGIKLLQPGHLMLVTNGKIYMEQYWDIDYSKEAAKIGEQDEEVYSENLRELIKDSVKLRLMSDVPLGAYLSGGLDSSIVTAIASSLTDGQLQTFSGAFKDGKDYDETEFARIVSEKYNTKQHEIYPNSKDFKDILPRLLWYLDEPRVGAGSFPQYYVSKLASENVKVILGGQGADEVFAGYARFSLVYWQQNLFKYLINAIKARSKRKRHQSDVIGSNITKQLDKRNVRSILKNLRVFLMSYKRRHYNQISFLKSKEKNKLFSDKLKSELKNTSTPWEQYKKYVEGCNAIEPLNKLLYLEIKTYLQGLLIIEDKMSMASSIESRVPLIDYRIVEYSAQIPSRLKVKGLTSKYILKKSVEDILPEEIINRRKMGFPVPIDKWFGGELKEYVFSIILSERAKKRGYFDYKYIEDVLNFKEKVDRRFWDRFVWTLLCFELWNRIFIDKVPLDKIYED